MTGKGHLTDYVILNDLGQDKTKIIFDYNTVLAYHPNGMRFIAYQNDNKIDELLLFSVGGGSLKYLNEPRDQEPNEVYPHRYMNDILQYCEKENLSLVDYVKRFENQTTINEMAHIYSIMKETVRNGLFKEDVLPGSLKVQRKAHIFYENYLKTKDENQLLYAYARSMAEENASGAIVVTSPTCGACGILPAVLMVKEEKMNLSSEQITNALLVAGLIGNIVRTNASISGAEVGCQGEVGVACSMATASILEINGCNNATIENGAEIALEHHLGLTCDPVEGLVQIPCIERNALAARAAISAAEYAMVVGGKHQVTLDSVIQVMEDTGKDLNTKYKETSCGGLALRKK